MRVYGKIVKAHTNDGWVNPKDTLPVDVDMYEIEYVDYREDGTICGKGTEDMTRERYKKLASKRYSVKKDIGERTATGRIKYDTSIVNKHNFFGKVKAEDSRKVKRLVEKIYPGFVVVSC